MIPNDVSHYNCYGIRGEDSKNNRTYHSLFPVPGEQPNFHRIQFFQPFTPWRSIFENISVVFIRDSSWMVFTEGRMWNCFIMWYDSTILEWPEGYHWNFDRETLRWSRSHRLMSLLQWQKQLDCLQVHLWNFLKIHQGFQGKLHY